jgi:hypothetical protein
MKVYSFFSQLVLAKYNEMFFYEVSPTELLEVMSSFQKGKILGPDKWIVELFVGFFDLMSIDLLRVVEEICQAGFSQTLIPPLLH